jgi:hypothetical protein
MVAVYFGNISQGKARDNLKLFVRAEVPFVGICGGEGTEKVSQTKGSDMVKEWQAAGAFDIAADSTLVELLDDALAVARVKYHTALVTGRAIFSLTSEGGGWRIAAVVYETRLIREPTAVGQALIIPEQPNAKADDKPGPVGSFDWSNLNR